MFGFVSRKEFEAHQASHYQQVTNLALECVSLKERIAKLEAANNCRDGKHEWFGVSTHDIGDGRTAYTVTTSSPDASCKHCGIKKDEWEKLQRDKTLALVVDAAVRSQTMAKNAKRTPTPRKKGKK